MATVERVTAQGAGASGRRLGRYYLAESLGAGPTGEVFRAKVYGVAGFERQFAVKRFHAPLVADADRAGLLARAARVYGALQHPRIARLLEFGVANEGTFAATEMVRGLHLRQLLQMAGPRGVGLLPGASAVLVAAAARAIGFAHSRGLSHLGLCPTNVLCTPDGDVKVTDFGYLSLRLPARPAEDPTLLQRIPYLAPEQLRGEGGTPATDVFQLGLIACELLTGQAPLAGVDPREVQRRALAGELPVVTLDLPRPLAQVIRRALSLVPIERFPDAGALADALDAAARTVPLAGDRRDVAALVRAVVEQDPPEAAGAPQAATMMAPGMMAQGSLPPGSQTLTGRPPPQPGSQLGHMPVVSGPAMVPAGMEAGRAMELRRGPEPPPLPVPPDRPETSEEPTGVRDHDEELNRKMLMPPVGTNGARPTRSLPPPPPPPGSLRRGLPGVAPMRDGNEEEETVETQPHQRMSIAERTLDALQLAIEGEDYTLETTNHLEEQQPPSNGVAGAGREWHEPNVEPGPPAEVRPPNVMMREPGAPRPLPQGKTPRLVRPLPPRKPRVTAPHKVPPPPVPASPPPPRMAPAPPLRNPPAPSPRSSRPSPVPPPRTSSASMPRIEPALPPASSSRSALLRAVADPGIVGRAHGSAPMPSEHAMSKATSEPAGPNRSARSSMSLRPGAASQAAPDPQFVTGPSSLAGPRVPPALPRMPPDLAGPGPGPSPKPGAPSRTQRQPAATGSPLETGVVVVGAGRPVSAKSSLDVSSLAAERDRPGPGGRRIVPLALLALALAGGSYYGYVKLFPRSNRLSDLPAPTATGTAPATETAKRSSSAGGTKPSAPPPAPGPASTAAPSPAISAPPPPAISSPPIVRDLATDLVITSEPVRARVYLDGALIGRTPVNVEPNSDRHKLAIIQPGYKPHIAEIDGRGKISVTLEEVTPSNGPAGIKIRCRQKNRYYVILDGAPTGQLCPTERLGVELGEHTAEFYDPVTDSRRVYKVQVEQTRLSVRVRVD